MAAASTGRRVVGAAAAAGAVGYGAYYASQAGVVAALEREREDLETKVFVSTGRARRAESDAQEAEALIAALTRQADLDSTAASEAATKLEAARAAVARLEAEQQQRLEGAARAQRDAAETASKLEQFKKDAARFRADAAARARMANPLRHPLVEQWRAGGGGGGGGGGARA